MGFVKYLALTLFYIFSLMHASNVQRKYKTYDFTENIVHYSHAKH